jgi:tetratricopeptide (TPR) repeat protein
MSQHGAQAETVIPEEARAAWQSLGRSLAAFRRLAGYTQQTLAPLVCYARSSIANIETGMQRTDRGFWIRVDRVLDAGGRLVAGYDEADVLQRRLRAKSFRTEASHSPASPTHATGWEDPDHWEDVESINARRLHLTTSDVDDARLAYLENAVLRAIADNERLTPRALMARVRPLRAYVNQLTARRQHPPQRTRLYTLASYLSGLLGALALDLGAFRVAQAYAAEAFDLGDVTGQQDVAAWARAAQSLVAYYAGDYHDALAYAQDGARRCPTGPHSIRLAINGEARALARLGDRYGVDKAVDRAFTLLTTHSTRPEVSTSLSVGPYCRARTAANAATAYLTLGRSADVTEHLTLALDAFDKAALPGPQALSRLDLATALLQQNTPEPEQASALALEAMTLTADQRYESVNQRARQFLASARPFAREPQMRHVAELLATRTQAGKPLPPALPSPP